LIGSYHFYFQKEARYLDGQILALKADSPLILTVTVTEYQLLAIIIQIQIQSGSKSNGWQPAGADPKLLAVADLRPQEYASAVYTSQLKSEESPSWRKLGTERGSVLDWAEFAVWISVHWSHAFGILIPESLH